MRAAVPPLFNRGRLTRSLCCLFRSTAHVGGSRWRRLCHCQSFSLKKLRSCLALFSPAPHGLGPGSAEVALRLWSWGSQVELADAVFETDTTLSLAFSPSSEGFVLDSETCSVVSSMPNKDHLLQAWVSVDLNVSGESWVVAKQPPHSIEFKELFKVIKPVELPMPWYTGSFAGLQGWPAERPEKG